MTAFRSMGRIMGTGLLAAAALAAGGCSSIRDSRGFIADPTLTQSVQPGIDNKQSVQAALGQPSFESQFGEPTWYYVSSASRSPGHGSGRIRCWPSSSMPRVTYLRSSDRVSTRSPTSRPIPIGLRHWAATAVSSKTCLATSARSALRALAHRAAPAARDPRRRAGGLKPATRAPYRGSWTRDIPPTG